MWTFFYGNQSPFSQWHPCRFVVEEVAFNCAEQFMMYGKAQLFGDREIATQILAASQPRVHKALGRKVRHFDDTVWKRERESIVYTGSRAKFTQNPALHAALIATRGTTLVEASPTDRVWGIGLRATDPRASDPVHWRGLNLLGKVLTRVRDDLVR